MTEDDEPERPRRPRRNSGEPDRHPREGRTGGPRERSGAPRDAARRATGRPARRDGEQQDRGGRRSTERAGRSPASDRPRREFGGSGGRPGTDRPRRDERTPRHIDEPELPDEVKPADLDKAARNELRTLSKENADAVARHLVMASQLIDDDPAEAHRHALAAGRRAGRVAVVRESVAITAYAVGDFALAIRELRTFRRISGSDDQVALLVDSERGVGRPDRALETGRAVDRATLPIEAQVGLAIAMSGARLDLGDPSGALDELERAPHDLGRVLPWTPDLYTAFVTVLEDLGDESEAAIWRRRADVARQALDEAGDESSTVDVDDEEPEAPSDDAGPTA